MFRRSRIKIVVAIMSILVCLFIGALAVIYSSSYYEVSKKNYQMLERHAEMYMLPEENVGGVGGKIPPDEFDMGHNEPMRDPGGKRFENTPFFNLSTFYSVAVSKDGEVISCDVGDGTVFDADTLEKYAEEILQSKKGRGTKENLIFLLSNKGNYTLVTFMDNTIMQESITTLFRYTFFVGIITLIALFFLAVYLAKRIVKPLEDSYEKQKKFISDAGHELKTPVSVVSANAELLSREIGNNKWLSNIQYENERMGELVGQLLELARTDSVTQKTEQIDLSRLVTGGVLPFESVAYEKGLVLKTDISEKITVEGNSGQLSQLVSIFIDNAIRHGKNGKEVYISLSENRGNAILSVVNDGEPISIEDTEKLFERFYRIDEVRNGEERHYGLGLAIAKAIVESHKGKIDVSCYDRKVCFSARIPKI